MRCKDPERSAVSAKPLKCPSDTAYPAGTICAKDFSRQACFSPGESGSPLMTLDDNIERFYMEGILSFVKGRGCDVYSNNPSVYTKLSCFLPWVAEQYGMSYKLPIEKDLFCTEGNPGSISKDPECLQKKIKSRRTKRKMSNNSINISRRTSRSRRKRLYFSFLL